MIFREGAWRLSPVTFFSPLPLGERKITLYFLYQMKWIFLSAGILFEVLGTISMKYAEGFTKPIPSILVFVFYGISLASLVFVLEKMQVSIAYAIWAGAGTALIAMIGILFYKEPVSAVKIISISLIILGILGLELID
jgi:small multidrug resistance pump